MIEGDVEIYEIDVDGPPKEPGDYLFWTSTEELMLCEVTEDELDVFSDYFDGYHWDLKGELVHSYILQKKLIEVLN